MRRKFLAWLALLALWVPCAMGQTRLMVVSDIHYLANELQGGTLLRALRSGDGKLTQHMDVLLDGLQQEIAWLRPDALLVTGDLAFNGERASHVALAQRFSEIEALGVPVWVLPGNHDINVGRPVGFTDEGWYPVEGVTPEMFSGIYADFMGTAGANLSYVADVGEDLRVAMTDVAFYDGGAQTFGIFMKGHADWLEAELDRARADGVTVITASHHSLVCHTEFLKDSYLMLGNEHMAALDERYGVRLHLSGHLHMQHIAIQNGLADAATGAFCAWPHRYALVTLGDDGSLTYEAKALSDDVLPEGFMDMSRAWYLEVARDKTRASLAGEALEDAERDIMADYAARFNLACFAGTFRRDDPAWREDPGYALWHSLPENLFTQYFDQMLSESAGGHLRLTLP